jgi:hypothetical protein
MLNMKKHLGSKQEFTNWLTTMYLFYLINRIVDSRKGVKLLPEIHRRVGQTDYDIVISEKDDNFLLEKEKYTTMYEIFYEK